MLMAEMTSAELRRGDADGRSSSDGRGAVGRIEVRSVSFEAPWDWLSAGWVDLWRHPVISFAFGIAFSAFAGLMLLGLFQFGWQSLILALAGGFLIVGPFIAVGLYEVSRISERGERPTFRAALTAGLRAEGQLSFLGAVLFFSFFAWLQIALLLFMMFMGTSGLPPPDEFIPTLLFTPHGLGLLTVGTIVGGLVAAAIFAMAAVSVPLLLERKLDAVTAISASVRAVQKNPAAMALWAVLIAGFIAVGIATLFIGLIVAFPLIAHATWHAYRDLIG